MTTLTIPHEAKHVHLPGYAPFCPDCGAEKQFVGFNRKQLFSSFMGWEQWDSEECAGATVAFPIFHDEDDFLWLVCTPGCKNCRRVSELESVDAGVADLRRAERGEFEMKGAA
jgi:hypothetical protein